MIIPTSQPPTNSTKKGEQSQDSHSSLSRRGKTELETPKNSNSDVPKQKNRRNPYQSRKTA